MSYSDSLYIDREYNIFPIYIYGITYYTLHIYWLYTCRGVTNMVNIVPKAGLEPTSVVFQASVLPLHHVCSLSVTAKPMPTCLCGSLLKRSVQTSSSTFVHLEL